MRRLCLAFVIVLSGECSALAGPLQECAEQLPFGIPQYVGRTGTDTTPLCRTAYVLSHDNRKLVPLWVTYRLSA